MINEVTQILRENKEKGVNDLVASLVENIPMYARADPVEVRARVDLLFELFLTVVETGDATGVTQTLAGISNQRISQGFAPSDFIRALLLINPVVRNVVRQAGPRNDAVFGHLFAEIENAVFKVVGVAANIFAAGLTRSADQRTSELANQNEQLRVQERALEQKAAQAKEALQAAQELNTRVISSLSSGVCVVEHKTQKLLLWSARMEELTGIPMAEALGHHGRAVVDTLKIEGMQVAEMIATVEATDRLPLTKIFLLARDGTRRALFMRGERLRSGAGEVRGTVLLLDDITERELLIDSFSRYVSKEVVQRLLSRSGKTNRLEGERRSCTILFADIRGFTGLSERITLEHLHELLNQYFRVMIDHCAAHDGVIDKFIGDKIMSIFSAGGAEGALAAARAAIAIQTQIEGLNVLRGRDGLEPIEIGIGINTGEVVMGTVGSEERMSFTVIGDPVNVADRLQSLAGPGEIYLGARTRELIKDTFEVEELGERALRGRTHLEAMFRLLRPSAS